MHENVNTRGMCGLLEHQARDGKGRWSHFSPFEQLLAWRSRAHFWWWLISGCLSLLCPLLCDPSSVLGNRKSYCTPTLPTEEFRSPVSCFPHGLPQTDSHWLPGSNFSILVALLLLLVLMFGFAISHTEWPCQFISLKKIIWLLEWSYSWVDLTSLVKCLCLRPLGILLSLNSCGTLGKLLTVFSLSFPTWRRLDS